MKNRSYANRGQPFEEFLRFVNSRYLEQKVAVIDKMPTEFIPIRDRNGKICSVKVERKSKADFIGRYKHYPIAIEAKHSSDDTIRWDRVEPHQADYMDLFTEEPGTIGMVVLSFNLKRFFAIPWVFWQAAYNARVRPGASKSTAVRVSAFGTTWDIPHKFSVRMDEIPAEFEIPNRDYIYGLNYLIYAERYVTPPLQP